MSAFVPMLLMTTASGACIFAGGMLARVERIRPRWLEQELRHTIIAFGGGVLLAAVAFVLVPEGQEYFPSPGGGVAIFLAGGVVFMLVERYLAAMSNRSRPAGPPPPREPPPPRGPTVWSKLGPVFAENLLFTLAALGAGCSVGPDYRAPEPVATGWAGSDDAANEAAAYDPQWWRSFGDPVLDRLVTRAAADNLELAAAAARVRQARAQRRAARSTLFPSIGGEASYTNYQLSKNGPGITGDAVEQGLTERDDSFYTAGFDAAYEIDIFGGNRRRRESAAAGEQLALERRRGVMLTVVAEVAREYMELRGAQKRLAITEKNAALQRDLTALVERKYRAGLSKGFKILRVIELEGCIL